MILPPRRPKPISNTVPGSGPNVAPLPGVVAPLPHIVARLPRAANSNLQPPLTASPTRLFLGLDLGLRQDHSTLALIEQTHIPTGEFDHALWQPVTRRALILRGLHRWPLGTPYIQISGEVAALLSEHPNPTLAIDASGPGAPILELLRSARTRAAIEPVLITSGHQPGRAKDSTQLIPRDHLISRLRITLERGLLILPADIPLIRELDDELSALGQPHIKRHDDLAVALALAVNSALRSLL